jgi:hypothetical protein
MKTLKITTAAILILFASASFASSPKRVLTLNDAMGRTLTMPMKVEEPAKDSLPFDLEQVFHQTRLESVSNQIDLSKISKPEPDADDIPAALRHLIAK